MNCERKVSTTRPLHCQRVHRAKASIGWFIRKDEAGDASFFALKLTLLRDGQRTQSGKPVQLPPGDIATQPFL